MIIIKHLLPSITVATSLLGLVLSVLCARDVDLKAAITMAIFHHQSYAKGWSFSNGKPKNHQWTGSEASLPRFGNGILISERKPFAQNLCVLLQ